MHIVALRVACENVILLCPVLRGELRGRVHKGFSAGGGAGRDVEGRRGAGGGAGRWTIRMPVACPYDPSEPQNFSGPAARKNNP